MLPKGYINSWLTDDKSFTYLLKNLNKGKHLLYDLPKLISNFMDDNLV